jgi:hypothetical protein
VYGFEYKGGRIFFFSNWVIPPTPPKPPPTLLIPLASPPPPPPPPPPPLILVLVLMLVPWVPGFEFEVGVLVDSFSLSESDFSRVVVMVVVVVLLLVSDFLPSDLEVDDDDMGVEEDKVERRLSVGADA